MSGLILTIILLFPFILTFVFYFLTNGICLNNNNEDLNLQDLVHI